MMSTGAEYVLLNIRAAGGAGAPRRRPPFGRACWALEADVNRVFVLEGTGAAEDLLVPARAEPDDSRA